MSNIVGALDPPTHVPINHQREIAVVTLRLPLTVLHPAGLPLPQTFSIHHQTSTSQWRRRHPLSSQSQTPKPPPLPLPPSNPCHRSPPRHSAPSSRTSARTSATDSPTAARGWSSSTAPPSPSPSPSPTPPSASARTTPTSASTSSLASPPSSPSLSLPTPSLYCSSSTSSPLGSFSTSSASPIPRSIGSVLIFPLVVGLAIVCAHGAFRVPEDLFLDDEEPAATGFLSFLTGSTSNTTASAVAARI
ncbi:prenylated RAB acceptor 1.B4 [Actinidia rufa]|uniref:Prenylated RAB acceptor 1.B4 n=1 Tax=Actinidia rufa TaxID=165716 RepID=A0A7J0EBH7_9ERIC|nr:prenylated RAB acceptor 1.B4 [Actinidia rufa]